MSTSNIITVNFRNDTLFAVERDDGIFVAPKPMSDSMGLAWSRQHARIKRDPILSEGMTTTVMPSPGGPQETTLLKMELVNGWLFTIDASRVKDEETRQKVLTYQRECYQVLSDHFLRKGKPLPFDIPDMEDIQSMPISTKLNMVREVRHWCGPKAAGQMWMHLCLPLMPAMMEVQRQLELYDYERIRADNAG